MVQVISFGRIGVRKEFFSVIYPRVIPAKRYWVCEPGLTSRIFPVSCYGASLTS
jgi:hypothetical protein